MKDREERFDALIAELQILELIWNQEVIAWSEHQYVPFGAVWWEMEQKDIAEALDMGERTVRRTCARLVETGRLQRRRENQHRPYCYHVTRESMTTIIGECLLRGMIHIDEFPNGTIVVEVIRNPEIDPQTGLLIY